MKAALRSEMIQCSYLCRFLKQKDSMHDSCDNLQAIRVPPLTTYPMFAAYDNNKVPYVYTHGMKGEYGFEIFMLCDLLDFDTLQIAVAEAIELLREKKIKIGDVYTTEPFYQPGEGETPMTRFRLVRDDSFARVESFIRYYVAGDGLFGVTSIVQVQMADRHNRLPGEEGYDLQVVQGLKLLH